MKTSQSLAPEVVGRRAGFTLIELLFAITILVLLAALVIGIAGWVQRKSTLAKARNQLGLLAAELQNYTADVHRVPEGRDDCGIMIYAMLFGDGVGRDLVAGTSDDSAADGRPDEGAHVYLAGLDPHLNSLKMIQVGPNGIPQKLVDPYGNPWRYRAGPSHGAVNPDFDLWSAGPDGVEGSADDIRNW